jgi:hypothetical protein
MAIPIVIVAAQINQEKIMHLLLIPILAFDDPGVATSGAVVLVILSVAAVIRSKMV